MKNESIQFEKFNQNNEFEIKFYIQFYYLIMIFGFFPLFLGEIQSTKSLSSILYQSWIVSWYFSQHRIFCFSTLHFRRRYYNSRLSNLSRNCNTWLWETTTTLLFTMSGYRVYFWYGHFIIWITPSATSFSFTFFLIILFCRIILIFSFSFFFCSYKKSKVNIKIITSW